MQFKSFRLVFLLLVAVVFPVATLAQTHRHPVPPATDQSEPEEEARAKVEKEMAKKQNEERQTQLKRDAEKLLKLATELKQYVDKTNESVLSLEVIKKAEEIEKLAKSVKEKMKGSS